MVEREGAGDHDVEDYAERPDVDFRAGVEDAVEQLGSGELEGAAEGVEEQVLVVVVGEVEVDDFDVVGAVDEDILYFEVSVDDSMTVEMGDCACDLLEVVPGRWLVEPAAVLDEAEKAGAVDVLVDHVEVYAVVEEVLEGDMLGCVMRVVMSASL